MLFVSKWLLLFGISSLVVDHCFWYLEMLVPGICLTRFAAKCLSQLVLDLFTVGICLVGGWDICAGETEVFASIII